MTNDKIELIITAKRTKYNYHPITIRTVHRGSNGKVRASTTQKVSAYLDGAAKTKRLEKALERFIQMYNLFALEMI